MKSKYNLPYVGEVKIIDTRNLESKERYLVKTPNIIIVYAPNEEEALEKIVKYTRKVTIVEQIKKTKELSDALRFLDDLDAPDCLKKYELQTPNVNSERNN